MKTRHKVLGTVTGAVILATIAAPAFAGSWTDTRMGAISTISGNSVWLRDNADDGKFVSVEYKMGAMSHALANKSGFGTTVSATDAATITNSRNCRSRWLQPMECSSWKY